MDISTPLFEGALICLTPIDHEKDAEVEAKWTHDAEYLRMLQTEPARPMAPTQVKKKYEAIEKEAQESKGLFYFSIRTQPGQPGSDGRLVGFARLYWVEWSHGAARIQLGIGDRNDRRRGYGSEALRLLMQYAFDELNLFRLSGSIPEYNLAALHLFEKAGFVEEARRREAVNRDGRRWGLIHMGLLREEREK